MSVTPPGNRSSSTPPSKKGGPDEGREKQKPFNMPKGKEHGEKEEKKKGLFDLTQEEAAIQGQTKLKGPEESIATTEVTPTQQITPAQQVTQISQIIMQTVAAMRIGQVDGKTLASLDLKSGPTIPNAFAGCNLTISYEQNGITIHFDNFMSPQQQNTAITMVEQNKEQLVAMMESLNAKSIQVNQLSIGTHMVNLPRVAALPPPFQPPSAAQAEGGRQQQQRDREGGEGQKNKK